MILWLHIFCVLIININADSPYSFKVPGIARIGNKPANNIEGSSNKGTFNNLRVQNNNMINKRKIHQANLNRTRLIQQNRLRKKLKLPMLRQNLRQKQGIPKYWQAELKGYVKDLIHRFGNVDLKTYTRPAIRAIENMHHVLITAIEVDEQGEVNIKYIPTNRNKRIRQKPVSQVPS